MSATRAGFQARFFEALFDRGDEPSLRAQPAFAVYRNTVRSGCIDALEANFPAVARLVGAAWFRAAAAAYVQEQPPRDGRLLVYGAGFADFLAGFAPARELPYLADVARLDRFWIEAHSAGDAEAARAEVLATRSPTELGALRLAPHPAARWGWFAEAPIHTIWSRNRGDDPADHDALVWQGEGTLLTRAGDAVQWQRATRAHGAFLDACAQGACLGDAAAAAVAADAGADLAAVIASLLHAGALIHRPIDPGTFA